METFVTVSNYYVVSLYFHVPKSFLFQTCQLELDQLIVRLIFVWLMLDPSNIYFEDLLQGGPNTSVHPWSIWTRGSKYFEVLGPHGGLLTSEGVQILQHISEVFGPRGPNTSKYLDPGEPFRGGPFFSWQLNPSNWTWVCSGPFCMLSSPCRE